MRVYVGQTRSREFIQWLEEEGIGEAVQRNEFPPRRLPFFLDNGAFGDWRKGQPFNLREFQNAVGQAAYAAVYLGYEPDFIVVPDKVAAGLESLDTSLMLTPWLEDLIPGVPIYLVVQDGMTEDDLLPHLSHFGGLFVGGSLPWKLQTAERWCEFAHENGLACHIGRVGTVARVRWAERIGADSIDSSEPLWSRAKLAQFLAVLSEAQQQKEFGF